MSSVEESSNFELQRKVLREKFVNTTNWAGAEISAIAQDVTTRKFFRLKKDGKTVVLMDARPPLEDIESYIFMRDKLANIGLRPPVIYDSDSKEGFIIMEDFGDIRAFELVSQNKVDLDELYTSLVDVLVHKYKADKNISLEGSVAYSDEYWLFRVEQFLIHYMPKMLKREVTPEMRKEFLEVFSKAIKSAHELDDVLIHGDYGVNNLYYFPEESGLNKVGIIDFQDLTDARGNMKGSPAFDLMFLLGDVRIDMPDEREERLINYFIEKSGLENIDAFKKEYATIAVAQATKCLGLFTRLGIDNGREQYLEFIPFCLRNLKKYLPHSDLKEIRSWFEKNNIDLNNI